MSNTYPKRVHKPSGSRLQMENVFKISNCSFLWYLTDIPSSP